METILANLNAKARRVSLNGRDYWVAPASMIVPGVLPGSKGPLFYPPSEMAATANSWDNIPLTAYHPTTDDGQPTSASEAPSQHIGFLRNPKFGKKLSAEAWFDVAKVKTIDNALPEGIRILPRLERGQPIELSTGLFTDNEAKPGQWQGREYTAIARNHRPDHLAVLPDQVGACSINDGCGIMVNKLLANSVPTINPAVSEAQRRYLNATMGHDWVKDHGFDNKGELPEEVENDCGGGADDDHTVKRVPMSNSENGLLTRFISWLVGNAQPRHPKDQTFQGHPHIAAKKGYNAGGAELVGEVSHAKQDEDGPPQVEEAAKRGSTHQPHVQPPVDDPDDDGDSDPEIGQGDRAPTPLDTSKIKKSDQPPSDGDGVPPSIRQTRNSNPEGHNQYSSGGSGGSKAADKKSDDAEKSSALAWKTGSAGDHNSAAQMHQKASEAQKAAGNPGAGMHDQSARVHLAQVKKLTSNAMDPHAFTKQAASASMDHGPAHEFGSQAVAASNDGNSKKAAGFHAKAADAHQDAATDARSKGDDDSAVQHDDAAALHMKAASAHNATCNSKGTDMIPQELIDNCTCAKSKAAMIAFNEKAEGSNADESGGGTMQAGGKGHNSEDADYEDDEAPQLEGANVKDKGNMGDPIKNMLRAMGFRSMEEANATLNMARRVERDARLAKVRQLVGNSRLTDAKARKALGDKLMKKSLDELDELSLLQRPVITANMLPRDDAMPLYIGQSAPLENRQQVADTDDILDLPTINWKEEVA